MRNIRTSVLMLLFCTISLSACTENYGNGERIGMVTRFSKKGVIWKSWEGALNLTQTGMNSSGEPFLFSIDNDREDPHVTTMIDSAANQGWKVKLTYHEVAGKNWFSNRGDTDHFITAVDVLDRNPVGVLHGNQNSPTPTTTASGHAPDTIYVVIVGRASEGFKLVPK